MRGPTFVQYCASDFLDGVQFLSPWEELAYRRICDLIYKTGDQVKDDDRKLAMMTKTGTRWRKIKAALLADDKLFITDDGRITNRRCQRELQKTSEILAQKSVAGSASAATGKSLQNLKQHRTEDRTGHRTNFLTSERDSPQTPQGGLSRKRRGEVSPGTVIDAPWEQRCRGWAKGYRWDPFWGPPPDDPGCYAPPDLVAEIVKRRTNGAAA